MSPIPQGRHPKSLAPARCSALAVACRLCECASTISRTFSWTHRLRANAGPMGERDRSLLCGTLLVEHLVDSRSNSRCRYEIDLQCHCSMLSAEHNFDIRTSSSHHSSHHSSPSPRPCFAPHAALRGPRCCCSLSPGYCDSASSSAARVSIRRSQTQSALMVAVRRPQAGRPFAMAMPSLALRDDDFKGITRLNNQWNNQVE